MSESSRLDDAINTYLVTSAVQQNVRATLAVVEAIQEQNRAVAQQQADAAAREKRIQIAYEQNKAIDAADSWVREDPIIAVAIILWSQQILKSNGVFSSAGRNLEEKAFIDRLYDRSARIIDQCGDNVVQDYNLLLQKLGLLQAQRGYLINEVVAKTPVNRDFGGLVAAWLGLSMCVAVPMAAVAMLVAAYGAPKFVDIFWRWFGYSQILVIPLSLFGRHPKYEHKPAYDTYRFWLPKSLERVDVLQRKDYWAKQFREIAPNADPGDRPFFERLRQSIENTINSHKPELSNMLARNWRWDAAPSEDLGN